MFSRRAGFSKSNVWSVKQRRVAAATRASVEQDSHVQIFLETERLLLRQFTDDDVDILVELDGDPDVMHFVTGGLPTPRARDRDRRPAGVSRLLRALRRLRLLGGDREVERPIPGLVPLQAGGGRSAERGRARLPAAQGRVGQGVRDRRLTRADRQGLRRARRRARRRVHDGRARRIAARAGKRGPALREDVSRALALPHPGRRGRRRRVRALESGVGGADANPRRGSRAADE